MNSSSKWILGPGFLFNQDLQRPAHESSLVATLVVTYAPEDEALQNIVEKFADDHDDWQRTFSNAWEKMQQNGHDQLLPAPCNGNLLVVKGP